MKLVLLGFLICVLSVYGYAAEEVLVYGTVVDQNDIPVPNATITFASEADTAQTTGLDGGSYSLYLNNTTAVDEQPERFTISLSQNYPNPFNPSTVITYEIDRTSHVCLDIYSILGQHVCTLENGMMPPGSHRVRWQGYDTNGQRAAAGVYLYLLRVDGYSLARKMVLIDGNNISTSASSTAITSQKTTIVPEGKNYLVTAVRGYMYSYSGMHTIDLNLESVHLDITMPDTYQPYFLFANSDRHNNEFIYAGDSILYGLVAHAETELPESCELLITSLLGDKEQVTLTGNDFLYRKMGECTWRYFLSSSQGTIETVSAESPALYNGILEIDAESDTVTAVLSSSISQDTESLSTVITVTDTVETTEIFGYSYVFWNGNYYVGSNTGTDWDRVYTDIIMVLFNSNVTDKKISDFIKDNNLTVKSILLDGTYVVMLSGNMNYIHFLKILEDNALIKQVDPDVLICVGKNIGG